jgi:hypothetical protein
MHRFQLNNRHRHVATCLLLVMLLVRASVPAGFMPQSGNPLQLQLCSAGMPGMQPAHTTESLAHATDCPFGHSPVAGPIAEGIVPTSFQASLSRPLLVFDTQPSGARLLRAQQARAPPHLV